MKLVIIESPYAGNTNANIAYAHVCLRDSLDRGEAPIASHLLYPQVLDDERPNERAMGVRAGLSWHAVCEEVVFYIDKGISPGMDQALEYAIKMKVPYSFRKLDESNPDR